LPTRHAAPCPLGHAERREARFFQWRPLGEERCVRRIGAGPATLDVVHAKRVERQRDLALVLDREIHALRLRPVAQRRVEDEEAFLGHWRPSTRGAL